MLAFVPDALDASRVGTWHTDFAADQTVCDETTASLFGVDPRRAAEGLPLGAYAKAIHPDDRHSFFDKIEGVRERGGLFVVEYRTCPVPGDVRWLLVRGRYKRDEMSGAVSGHGIVIDITESKLDGQAEDRIFFVETDAAAVAEMPLDEAASSAIAARMAIDRMAGGDALVLREAVDALLWTIGRALAKRQSKFDS